MPCLQPGSTGSRRPVLTAAGEGLLAEARRVADGADALLTMRGNIEEQHRYVLDLPHEVRLTLCMWLMDTDLALA